MEGDIPDHKNKTEQPYQQNKRLQQAQKIISAHFFPTKKEYAVECIDDHQQGDRISQPFEARYLPVNNYNSAVAKRTNDQ